MARLFEKYTRFIRGVSVNRIGRTGVILTTSSFVTFIFLELARLSGVLANAYIGLITYLLLPVVFIVGLVLIPIGWRRRKRQTGKSTRELLQERFEATELEGSRFGSRLVLSITILTLVNVLFMIAASSRMLKFMDEPVFCGTACHSVMNPEWVTYQQSPHARVKCVECHVGEGVDALIDSKLNGTWQMISVTFDLLERPIPTPVHQLRPARETCEKCHWPEKFYGSRLKTITRFAGDESSSRSYTTLNLKIDAGSDPAESGIHWHVNEANEVRYASVDDEREEMIWVEVRQPDGAYKRYANRLRQNIPAGHDNTRTLDCVDCHNRATHIYEEADDAVDRLLATGKLDRSLPYIRREAQAAMTNEYADSLAALAGIANHLQGFYSRLYPSVANNRAAAIDEAIDALRTTYLANIFHGMNITWGTYRSHLGHRDNGGCFRCHNENMVAEDGAGISSDCALCHSLLAYDSEEAFEFLMPADTTERNYDMHRYLRQEFLEYLNK